MNHWLAYLLCLASPEEHEEKDTKSYAIRLIIIGLFFAPALFGFPILIFGIIKLLKAR
jgi:hypothetical protein